jgi:hypothetical protein
MPKKTAMHQVPVTVTHGQFKTLMKGGKIRLKKEQLTGKDHVLHLSSNVKARKLLSSKSKNKGCEISLAPDEFRATMEGEGFKEFANWLKGATRTGWKVAKRVGHHLDTVASNAAPGVGQAIGTAAKSAAPVAGKAAAAYLMGGDVKTNPGDNMRDMVEGGALFGIHNRTPDHVLFNNNSNFIANTHPASNPTLLQNDPLAKIHLGKVISRGSAASGHRLTVHPAVTPLLNEKENLRNTPAFQRGGSFAAAGYGFKPSGY